MYITNTSKPTQALITQISYLLLGQSILKQQQDIYQNQDQNIYDKSTLKLVANHQGANGRPL